MTDLSAWIFLRCFLRSYCVGAAYNPQGLQNIGMCYAMEPALAALYGEGPRLAEARLRYARHYNCHPFMTPMLIGAFVHMEMRICSGHMDKSSLENVKDVITNSFSGIGDSFFNGSLLITWVLAFSVAVVAKLPLLALAITIIAFILLQLFKFISFIAGLRKGFAIWFYFKRLDLINQGDSIKGINALLLTLFLWLCLPGMPGFVWIGSLVFLLVCGWGIGKKHIPRVCIAMLFLGGVVALHLTGAIHTLAFLWVGLE